MMKMHLPLFTISVLSLSLVFLGCDDSHEPAQKTESSSDGTSVPALNPSKALSVSISDDQLHSFISKDTLEQITQNLFDYFESTNEADWDQLMHFFPLHKNSDTAFVNSSKRALDYWTERGVQNRTEMAQVVYASPSFLDGDQEVVLINMNLRHYVEFLPHYDGPSPSGMKGMVESNYGKGNATYKENEVLEGDSLAFRYWEITGLNRIWALSHVDSAHWCFLPPNFNESGSAYMMSSDAMVGGLRHRRENDPTAQK
ncbi:MAG: hypothetical protein HOH92_01345 [Crocinitomicaceae bacterium]|jgi:hypothetical protein|nr:hypothetical protein [Crocinitomicaceae bacterium]